MSKRATAMSISSGSWAPTIFELSTFGKTGMPSPKRFPSPSSTAQVLAHVKARNRDVDFVWIMGADNLRTFHLWQNWHAIAETFPIAVIDRPGSTLSFLSSKMARTYDFARVDENDAGLLARMPAPAWTFIHGPRSSLSSTLIRSKQAAAR